MARAAKRSHRRIYVYRDPATGARAPRVTRRDIVGAIALVIAAALAVLVAGLLASALFPT